ncbi:MAG TPA: nuclear transport factor 2 family protein [Humisphaera sp.]
MSVQSVAREFVDLCRQGKNFDVMRTLYAPDIVSVEGDGTETAGQQKVIDKSANWVSDKSFDYQEVRGPYFNGPNQFAVHFLHKVTPKATGKQVTLEEVAVYTVNAADKITREVFYFEGSR